MKNTIVGIFVAVLMGLFQLTAHAEDIDLFSGTRGDESVPPNLLIVIDNAANFSSSATFSCQLNGAPLTLSLAGTTGGVEQCALYNVVSALDLSSPMNLGFMVYNHNGVVDYNGTACPGSGGGCLVYPLTKIDNEGARTRLLTWIASWKTSNGGAGTHWMKANNQSTGAVMQEAWAYMYGHVGLSGTDYALTQRPNTNCKNFLVFIGNAFNNNSSPGDSTGEAGPRNALLGINTNPRKNANPAATQLQREIIPISAQLPANTGYCGTVNFPSENQHENAGYFADEWARYMASQRITTYTVGLMSPNCTARYAWQMQSMARNGGGNFFPAYDYTQLIEALNNIVSEVRSVNSVFAAVSLPVSVNSQGTYLNQVFIGMFRPDAAAKPRWNGNLKQYRMGFYQGQFSLLDAGDTDYPDGRLAISASGSEFVAECARSFWTPLTTDTYWSQETLQNCASTPAVSNFRDGNIVEKGGQGYMLRRTLPANRVVKTCSSSVAECQTAMTNFDTNNASITAGALGLTAATPTAATLIDWARGRNNHSSMEVAEKSAGVAITDTDMRPSVHGDVVHSRPAAINFGTDANPKVVVFYGGNDGMLRAINGNRTAPFDAGGRSNVAAGEEFWSFMPPEYYTKLLRRWNNSQLISPSARKDYAMDGPISAYRAANGDAWLFVGMRRGGRALYAFKVDGSTLNVTLMWKRGCVDDTNCDATARFTGMGQTWSAPQVFLARSTGSTKPLLIMGGGYDNCEDTLPASCTSTSKGNRFYVLEAESGNWVATFNTARGVIADVTIVPDSEGFVRYIYGTDLGGNIYRISGPALSGGGHGSIASNAPSTWMIKTVASLGCDATQTCTDPGNRKFMYAPDVVIEGSTYWLLAGSGDREKPTELNNPVSNYFFAVKDRPDLGDSHLTDTACDGFPGLCLGALHGIERGTSATADQIAAKKGWYLGLHSDEQVVTGAIAVYGTVYFTTHQPTAAASNSCVPNLGKSRAYAVKYSTAANARSTLDAFIMREDAGLAPDLVVGKVTLDNNSTVPFCIGCDGPIKPSQPIAPGLITNPAKIRSYWYIQK